MVEWWVGWMHGWDKSLRIQIPKHIPCQGNMRTAKQGWLEISSNECSGRKRSIGENAAAMNAAAVNATAKNAAAVDAAAMQQQWMQQQECSSSGCSSSECSSSGCEADGRDGVPWLQHGLLAVKGRWGLFNCFTDNTCLYHLILFSYCLVE